MIAVRESVTGAGRESAILSRAFLCALQALFFGRMAEEMGQKRKGKYEFIWDS
jgi:hypothetical protein